MVLAHRDGVPFRRRQKGAIRLNAYDFDDTIYDGDSTRHFYRHCLLRYPGVLLYSLRLIAPGARFLLGRMDKTDFKRRFFGFLRYVPDVEREVLLFWDRHECRIKPFYRGQRRPDDLILSASPEFLLGPALIRLGVRGGLIGSRVDARTGAFVGKNCHAEEKVERLKARFPEAEIDRFYSDSLSDAPLARISGQAFLVRGNRILPWPERSLEDETH